MGSIQETQWQKIAFLYGKRKTTSSTYRFKFEPFFLHINWDTKMQSYPHLIAKTKLVGGSLREKKRIKKSHFQPFLWLGHFFLGIQDGSSCVKLLLPNGAIASAQ